MKRIDHIRVPESFNLDDLTAEYARSNVLGAGRFAKSVNIVAEMFLDHDYVNFLSLAGPLVPAGLRNIIVYLVRKRYIKGIVSTGANITHDLLEAIGFHHTIGNKNVNDSELRKKNIGRIYDIWIKGEAYEALEKRIHQILDDIDEKKRSNLSTYDLFWEVGRRVQDKESIVKTSEAKGVPIFCPAIYDSMLGIDLWTYSQIKKLALNPFLDFNKIVEMNFKAKKIGAIIIGGGVPKHYTLAASILRGGVDAAIQITFDRPEAGGLSGAPLEESISWRKAKDQKCVANIIGDAILIFPMLITAVMNRLEK